MNLNHCKKTRAIIVCLAVAVLGVAGGNWLYPTLTTMIRSWHTSAEIRSAMISLNGTNEAQRLAAISTLGWLGKPAKEAIPMLQLISQADNQKERLWSYAAIARITDDPKPEVDQLIRVITNEPNIWVRLKAAKAVAEIGSKASDAIPVLNAFAQEAFKSRDILLAVSIQGFIARLRDNIADVSPAFKPSIIQTNGGF